MYLVSTIRLSPWYILMYQIIVRYSSTAAASVYLARTIGTWYYIKYTVYLLNLVLNLDLVGTKFSTRVRSARLASRVSRLDRWMCFVLTSADAACSTRVHGSTTISLVEY
jgi:hypothetical protein